MSLDNFKYCKRCGKLYKYNYNILCPDCVIKTDEDFKVCRDYIEEHKNVTIRELAEATGVSEKVILILLREGRLQFEDGSGILCEKCGELTAVNGRYCEKCLSDMVSQLEAAKKDLMKNDKDSTKPYDIKSRERMHIANNIKKKRK